MLQHITPPQSHRPHPLRLKVSAQEVQVDEHVRQPKRRHRDHHNPDQISCRTHHMQPAMSGRCGRTAVPPTRRPGSPPHPPQCRSDQPPVAAQATRNHACTRTRGLNTDGSGHCGPGDSVPPTTVEYLVDQNACSRPEDMSNVIDSKAITGEADAQREMHHVRCEHHAERGRCANQHKVKRHATDSTAGPAWPAPCSTPCKALNSQFNIGRRTCPRR